METKALFVLMLAYCANTAFSIRCYKCFGNSDVCNNNTLESIGCLDGQYKCLSMKVERDGKETRLHGCATQNDCDTSEKSCASAASGRTNCETECCTTNNCNMAPYKDSKLRCYTCQSASSMDDCRQNSKAMTCQHGEDRCAKFSAEVMAGDHKIMVYRKGCRAQAACDKTKDLFGQGCGTDGSECDFKCCEGDLCNTGLSSTVSFFMLIASTILSLVYLS